MRIWVTGLGRGFAPRGRRGVEHGRAAEWAACLRPGHALRHGWLPLGDRGTDPQLDVASVAPQGAAAGWSRTDTMAVRAAREALAQAGLDDGRGGSLDLILGGTTAGMFETEDLLAEMYRDPEARQPLERMLSHPLSATADRLQQVVAPFRRSRTLCSACSSGANAVLLAAAWLRTGRSERVLAGGADGLCRLTYTGFSCLGALSAEPCRPFDRARQGLNLGEAAAFLVIETEQAARARGAEPLVELRGWAVGAEAHHITNPQASGETAARVMSQALARAGIGPAELDYVNAHGTATPLNDKMEAAALARCLGDDVKRVAVSSSKGQIGHTLGAAGAVEAVIGALSLTRGVVPPTAGLEDVDPDCAHLVHVPHAREMPLRAVMSNSFGFGGSDAVLVLARPGLFDEPAACAARTVVVTASGSIGPLGGAATRDAARYLEPGDPPQPGAVAFEANEYLDVGRARRIDRAGRLSAAAMKIALGAAGFVTDDPKLQRTGAIMGEAFGSVDECSAFIHRVYEKGAKFASPAVFPNLLPSSPVAHASIYHALRGPVFANADLAATPDSAMAAAVELIAAGEADAMIAGGVEQSSAITERVLEPLFGWSEGRGARSEGTAVLMFEHREQAADRAVAVVRWWSSWRGAAVAPAARAALADAPPARSFARAALFVARPEPLVSELALATGWQDAEVYAAAPRAGEHEAAGGFAAAAAVARLAAGELDAALVLGLARDRGYAMLFERCSDPR